LAILPDIEEENTLGISVSITIIFQRKEKLLLHLVTGNSTYSSGEMHELRTRPNGFWGFSEGRDQRFLVG
jgi:hypothetical protein